MSGASDGVRFIVFYKTTGAIKNAVGPVPVEPRRLDRGWCLVELLEIWVRGRGAASSATV